MSLIKRAIDPFDYAPEIIRALDPGAYLTTKAKDKVNTMVIGWGHIGRIWAKPAFNVYVRHSRFTHELLDQNPEFTVNIPLGPINKKAFKICGTQSGRDIDKIAEAELTPVEPEVISVPGLKEFPLTLECRVLYRGEQDTTHLVEDLREHFYPGDPDEHIEYFGEIVAAYIIEETEN